MQLLLPISHVLQHAVTHVFPHCVSADVPPTPLLFFFFFFFFFLFVLFFIFIPLLLGSGLEISETVVDLETVVVTVLLPAHSEDDFDHFGHLAFPTVDSVADASLIADSIPGGVVDRLVFQKHLP